MPWFYSIIIFIFGLCLGSFLNVVICRIEKGKGFIRGRSVCPKCKHALAWYDLIPLVSFVCLLGRCRYCKKKISWQYPLVEMATAILFLIFYFLFLNHFLFLIFCWLVSALLIIIFVYDLKTMYIPSKVVYLGMIVALLYFLINWDFAVIINHLLAGLGFAAFLFVFWLVSKGRWMGFGDVELAFLLGFFLGWPQTLIAVFFAFVSGGLAGVLLIIFGKKKLQSAVPLGPFLIAGCFFALYFGRPAFNFLFPLWL